MTDSNVGASSPFTANLGTEVAAFATRIPVETVARAADIYERAVQASADLLTALLDREEMASELERLYREDKPEGLEGGDWLVAIEDHIGLSAAHHVFINSAGWVTDVSCASAVRESAMAMQWPETAWPLSFPRPGLAN